MNINNLIERKLPESQKILKVPFKKNPVPKVNDGNDPNLLNKSIAPNHINENHIDYCNILPPAPRNQLNNYPQKKPCDKLNAIPYTKNSCYLVNNKAQGVVGLVCNNAGGSNNSNFERGNRFGQDYVWINEYELKKKKEYTVEQPEPSYDYPTIIRSSTNFYPIPSFPNRSYPWYRTYPRFKKYTAEGLPIYTYPYKIINNPKVDVIEKFESQKDKQSKIIIPGLLVSLVLIFLLYLLN